MRIIWNQFCGLRIVLIPGRADSFNPRAAIILIPVRIVLIPVGIVLIPLWIVLIRVWIVAVLEGRENVEIGREMKDMSEPRNEVRR